MRAVIRVLTNSRTIALVMALAGLPAAVASGASAETAVAQPPAAAAGAAPADHPFPGEIRLTADATDVERRIVHVHETITGLAGDAVLRYPKWLPGRHGPNGPIQRVAGLVLAANGTPLAWRRDPLDVYAFHVAIPADAPALEVDFDYLAPTSPRVGHPELSDDLSIVEWISITLYPTGYFARQVPVAASLVLPAGWTFASALEIESGDGARATFKRVSLETLLDSPVYAARHFAQLDLDPGAAVPVRLDLFADRPESLVVSPAALAAHRAMIQQAYKLFGSHHYAHYDFLLSLSDSVEQLGREHHQSSEDGQDPSYFTDWDKTPAHRDLLAHEFTHSWNGKFRRPGELWVPSYEVPMQSGLLWVYEGQTQYWGKVLTARAGMWTRQQALDDLALTAANYDVQPNRRWRALQDTSSDEVINPRRPMPWRSWQGFEDYYEQGQLIWLDVDTLIRERSGGRRSLDDFARAFFGVENGRVAPLTYGFEDIVKALDAVEPYDWATLLHAHLDSVGGPAPLAGLRRGGYQLVYTDVPGDYLAAVESQRKTALFTFSLGLAIASRDGSIASVQWDSPAFKAGLTEGTTILAVNGVAYSAELLKDAIRAARGSTAPIELIVKAGDRFRVVAIDYHDGLRYPHLKRDPAQAARLDQILAPRS